MKKILIIINTGFEEYGGLATVMMNYYRKIKKDDLQIDFASTNILDEKLEKELSLYGSKYFCLGPRNRSPFAYRKNLTNVILAEKYDVLHVNGNSATMVLELSVAKKLNVPVRIAHCHTTQSGYPALHKVLYKSFNKAYTVGLACSKPAGEWLFDNQRFLVLNNAIDTEKFSYSQEIRQQYRQQLGIENQFVVGTLGKLMPSKNHAFLVDVFFEIQKKYPNAKLLMVGDGDERKALEEQIDRLGIAGKVLMLGMRTDNTQLLQTMDVFVFPSVYEGLGLALIEAQATGLTCFASTNVPREAGVTELVEYLDLSKGAEYWANQILACESYEDREKRCQIAKQQIQEHGYDIQTEAHKLYDIYTK